MSKGRLLSLWVGLTILAYIFASQDWYSLSMAPNGETVKLAAFDGLTAYGNLSPVLMLNFAAILTIAFVGSLGRKISAGTMLLVNFGTALWTYSRVTAQDISGLAKQVEQMTGIAAAHSVEDLTVITQAPPYGFLLSLFATALLVGYILVVERKWPKRSAKTERTNKNPSREEPKDAIGIWDSQR